MSRRGLSWDPFGLFSVLINDIDNQIEGTLSKFADYSKQSDAGDATERRDVIRRDLDRL